MTSKITTFLKNRKETLSLFGINRYHDWSVLFLLACIAVLLIALYAFFAYRETSDIINGGETYAPAYSSYNRTVSDFQKLSTESDGSAATSSESIPRNPALR